MSPEPLKLFYCYAHADAKLRKRLDDHLALLKREGVISEWHDGDITAGKPWEEEIHQNLEDAHLILLLISSSFLASDYCYDIEMQEALERQETGTAHVIPIILRECDWRIAPFRKLQALPSNGKPVTMWRDKDAAFADIARGIREIANAPGFIREREEALPKGSPSQVPIPQTVATSLEISPHTLSPASHQKLAAYLQQQQNRHTSVLASGSRSLRVCDVISDTNLFIPPVWKDEGGAVVSEGLIEYIAEAMREQKHFLLLGEAGHGKTIILKYVSRIFTVWPGDICMLLTRKQKHSLIKFSDCRTTSPSRFSYSLLNTNA